MAINTQAKSFLRTPIRHMVRQIAAVTNAAKGYKSVEDVDSEIGSMILQGYRLVNTHFLRAQTDAETGLEYFGVMYILQLDQSEIEKLKKSEKVE